MSSFSIGAGIAPAADIARLASQAEDAGFDAIWTQEMFHDPFLPLASAAAGTSRITLGTSIGWSDIYPFLYYEQYIDITDLSGRYALVHIVDPENVLFESDETNNASRRIVRLPSGTIVR